MRKHTTQFAPSRWPVNNGPLVVLGESKTTDKRHVFNARDVSFFDSGTLAAAVPQTGTGPPAGTGSPVVTVPQTGTGPPTGTGLPTGTVPQTGTGPPGGTGPPDTTGLLNGKSPPLNTKANVEISQQRQRKNKTKTQISFEEIKKMKHLKLKRLLGLVLTGCISILYAQTASAVAGATISNTATLTFDVGGTATVLESSLAGNTVTGVGNGTSTDFTEDRLVNFTVAEVGAATTLVAPSATLQVQTFTVTNNGNATQDFLLAAVNAAGAADPHGGAADSFNPTLSQTFVEDGTTVGFQSAEDTVIYIDELAPLGVATVYIVSTIPAVTLPLANGDTAVMSLVVQNAAGGAAAAEGAAVMRDDNNHVSPAGTFSNGGTVTVAVAAVDAADTVGAMDTVFNDPAGVTAADVSSAGVQDVVQNGQHSDSDSYTVGAPVLTVSKASLALYDPVNLASNPKSIPGGYVTFTITISNAAGAASGDLTTLGDTLAAALALDPNFVDNTLTAISAVGDSFEIDTTGTARPSAAVSYCTAAVDADGCSGTLVAGGVISINLATEMGVEAGYTAGELKAGESIVIKFNAIVQ